MQVFIGRRNFAAGPADVPGGLRFTAGRYSHRAVGGPHTAEIIVMGSPAELRHLAGLLRCPVVIYNDKGEPVWWGYVETAEWRARSMVESVTLAGLYNRVRVDYAHEYGDEAGKVDSTGWSVYGAGVDPNGYGRRELMLHMAKATAGSAQNYRDSELARLQNPQREWLPGSAGERGGRLLCRGWWNTLGWRHLERFSLVRAGYQFENPAALMPLFIKASDGTQDIAATAVYQSFTVPATVTFRIMAFYMRRTAAPDALSSVGVDARFRSGATPTTSIAVSARRHPSTISEEFSWLPFLFSSQQTANTSTTYWAGYGRGGWSGGVEVAADEGMGYTGGTLLYQRAGENTFRSRSPNADIGFALWDILDSTELIGLIATTMGEFITGYDVEAASGIEFTTDREPDQNALDELQLLIKAGTTNQRRVLVEVRPDRRVRIRPEPAATAAGDFVYLPDGRLLDANRREVDATTCPVGMWVRDGDPLAFDPVTGGPVRTFVEEAECAGGQWRPRARGQQDWRDFTINATLGYPTD